MTAVAVASVPLVCLVEMAPRAARNVLLIARAQKKSFPTIFFECVGSLLVAVVVMCRVPVFVDLACHNVEDCRHGARLWGVMGVDVGV